MNKLLDNIHEKILKSNACEIITQEEMAELIRVKESDERCMGQWNFDAYTAKFGNPYRCSNCEEEFGDTYNFCPNCGTDMRASKED